MSVGISVKQLAEFVHRRGDLYPPVEGRTRAEEGIAVQKLVQQRRGDGYQRELTVNESFVRNDIEIEISGRVDGYLPERGEVEEIKTTRTNPTVAEACLGSAHWAQLTLYASLLARSQPRDTWLLTLNYCHPETHAEHPFQRTQTAESLAGFLDSTLSAFADWHAQQREYRQQRNLALGALEFPYGYYRPHQRAMARRTFQAFRDGERLLLEAPTGSGKTMGLLYPALKAVAAEHVARLFFLTSRGTGAIAALEACRDIESSSQPLRFVELIAKEKACAVPGTACDAQACAYARGYFDRIRPALSQLLTLASMDAAKIREVAEAHRVCPFELSLDAALWADVIVGDYNYLLDPVVRLQRFADDESLGLLVDESHQLADRTRSMLSLRLERVELKRALDESPPELLCRKIRGLDRALMALRREAQLGVETPIDEPVAVLRAIERLIDALAEEDIVLEPFPATRDLVFNAVRWQRSAGWRDPHNFRFFAASVSRPAPVAVEVRLECLDAAEYLARVLGGYGAHVRFSGTVTPLALYQRLHGFAAEEAERVQSSFSAAQLAVHIVNDVSVLYRDRAATLSRLTDLVADICAGCAGNYLVALPSFAYLEDFANRFAERFPHVDLQVQQRHMDDGQRAAFLAAFTLDSTRLGVVVMGGVFTESVDFAGARLRGVICVGIGLPPAGPVREAVACHFDTQAVRSKADVPAYENMTRTAALAGSTALTAASSALGETVAYQQPAMSKILQAAGRLLRGPEDRGVICLIDGRFCLPEYQRFFPRHWQPRVTRAASLAAELQNFWRRAPRLPRLPGQIFEDHREQTP